MSVTSTSLAAAATAASGDARGPAVPSKTYGAKRRSIAFSASWIATCVMAYMRDSNSGLPSGEMQAAIAASPAFAFHTVTASVVSPIEATEPAPAGAAIVAINVIATATKRVRRGDRTRALQMLRRWLGWWSPMFPSRPMFGSSDPPFDHRHFRH